MIIGGNIKMIYRSLILDYINGEDIENIDELENNYKFMMEVIKLTHDKNMFNMCSNEVKLNYEFVRFMIDTFKNDIQFIDKIASDYIDAMEEGDVTSLELIFIMADILKSSTETDLAVKYNLFKNSFIAEQKVKTNIAIIKEEDLFWKEEFGLGFRIIQYEYYCNSSIIMNEIALDLVEDIFYQESDISLEELIHNRFKTLDEFNKIGVRRFILNYVRMYDTNLADYLEDHIDLLKDMERNISVIVSRFDIYNKMLEARKKLIFTQEAYQILDKYNETTPLEDYLRYIDKQKIKGLPILEFRDYDPKEFGLEGFEDFSDIDINNLTCYKIIKELINLAKDLYLGKEVVVDIKDIVTNNKAKILDFDLSKRNNHKRLVMKPKDKIDN